MGIRRVRITCSNSRESVAGAAYDLLMAHRTCHDLTHGDGIDSTWIQFLSEDQDVPRTLAHLAEHTGVGTEAALRVAISEVLTTVPPLLTNDDSAEKPLYELLAPRPRRTMHEIYMAIHSGCQLTFDYLAMVAAAATIATVGLVGQQHQSRPFARATLPHRQPYPPGCQVTDSSVSVVASMLLSPLMSPILCITFGLATGHPALIQRGFRTEMVGVVLALMIGLLSGLILATWYGPRHLGVSAVSTRCAALTHARCSTPAHT
jgi:hypothetical protein